MPPHRKQPPATESSAEKRSASPSAGVPRWKWILVSLLFGLIALASLWGTGAFRSLFAGPKIPLPRAVGSLTLGMDLDEVIQKYPLMNLTDLMKKYPKMGLEEIVRKHPNLKKKMPEMQRALRPFNNDPLFGITTLNNLNGLSGASSMDLLFFKNRLYFVSAMWEGAEAQSLPFQDWVRQFRRWNSNARGSEEPLGSDVMLKEWKFSDGPTEMTLRDLNYSGKIQRWQDLRDSSDAEAQAAFAKYRLEAGGN
ncbi:MAG TPA: hypothetical protein VMV05_07285 [bacterium]|nr:hypothetical protein [bacterium]